MTTRMRMGFFRRFHKRCEQRCKDQTWSLHFFDKSEKSCTKILLFDERGTENKFWKMNRRRAQKMHRGKHWTICYIFANFLLWDFICSLISRQEKSANDLSHREVFWGFTSIYAYYQTLNAAKNPPSPHSDIHIIPSQLPFLFLFFLSSSHLFLVVKRHWNGLFC